MRISIGIKPISGPWGGGNQFGKILVSYLEKQGHKVSFDLRSPDLDIVFLFSPNPKGSVTGYTDKEIFHYLRRVNSSALVVHRVNECDERKGTSGVNAMLRRGNLCADVTVFVSDWLRRLHLSRGWPCRDNRVILNGSDNRVFHSVGHSRWNEQEPLRLVTHHWGVSWNKGFDIYQRLDKMMADERWKDKIEFSYIGNLPSDFQFENANYYPPCSGKELADLLRNHHVYVTASRFEPGSNHQNEGALCGLPLLYIEHTSMPEYCKGFGVGFIPEEFEENLSLMMSEYDSWVQKMTDYPNHAERMCEEYLALFKESLAQRDALLSARRFYKYPYWRFLRRIDRWKRKIQAH
jgi:hypothetical protein